MRWSLTLAFAFFIAACGGNVAVTPGNSNSPSNTAPPEKEKPSLTAEQVRDAYIAAMDKLDGEGMCKWLTKAENERSGRRIVRNFGNSRESSNSYRTKILLWKQVKESWQCDVSSTMMFKDGGTHTLQDVTFFVVKEGSEWRVSWQDP